MKKSIFQTVFKGVCFILLIMTATNGMAQYEHLSKEEKERKSIELINEAEYLIEGKPVSGESFYGPDGKTIYTDLSIEVTHWYKGKGKKNIHLILKGGEIRTRKGEDLIVDNQTNRHSSGPGMMPNTPYFMVLKRSKIRGGYEFVYQYSVSSYGRYSNSSMDDFYIRAFYSLEFDSIDDFETFTSRLEDVKLPRKKKDVTFGKSSINDVIWIDEPHLQAQMNMHGAYHAGVGEELTIRGTGFGNNKGQVLFVNGDRPDLGHFSVDDHYVTWSVDEITVELSSWNKPFTNLAPNTIASGTIVIRHADYPMIQQKETTAQINIEYSINNNGEMFVPKTQIYLAQEHCLNGMVFTLHKSFLPIHPDPEINPGAHLTEQQSDDAIASVVHALNAWSTELGITLELEKNSDAPGDYHFTADEPFPPLDGFNASQVGFLVNKNRNILIFKDAILGNAAMETKSFDMLDNDDSNWRARADIRILKNPSRSWVYNRTGSINHAMKEDFYHSILHEIGHAIGLGHSIDLTHGSHHVMAPVPATTGVSNENQRITLSHPNSTSAKNGAGRIVGDSRTKIWSAPPIIGNFYDKFGGKKLAPSGINSQVKATPKILSWMPSDPVANSNGFLIASSSPSQPHGNYFWLPNKETSRWVVTRVCSGSDHYVRVKDAACSISSLYSLPEELPLPGCPISDGRDDEALFVYPNPTTGQLNIEFQGTEEKSIDERDTYIGIYDNLGRLQKQHMVSDATLRQTTIDISTLSTGTYWVVWFADGEVIDTKQVQKN